MIGRSSGACALTIADPTPQEPARAFIRGLSLRSRLIVLVMASVLPLLMFTLVRQYLDYQEARAMAGERALTLARSATLVVERELQTRISALQVLALSRVLEIGDLVAFRARAQAVVAQQFPGANILLLDGEGQQVMNLAVPDGQPLPARRHLDTLRQVFATGRPAVSQLYHGVVLNRPVVSIEVPVKRQDGGVVYSLAINPDLGVFANILREQQIPRGWVVSVFDQQGVIVARIPNPEQFVGHKAAAGLLPALLSQREGIVEVDTLEGIPVISGFSRTATHGWSVGVGVPRATLGAPAREAAIRTLLVGGAALLIGMVLAVMVSRRISGPIASLRRLAAELPEGGLLDEPRTGLRETDEVARALHAAERKRRDSQADERRARQALDQSEEQLRQAQKLDAIGQLTGGVAHDFNNILTVIMGTSELLIESAPRQPKLVAHAETILRATERGAAMVAQLMAFARKQTLAPTMTDVNALVIEAAKLLKPTLGEDIEIESMLEGEAWPVLIDASQLSTALLNLAVNARDAMPDGGKLTLETGNVVIDEAYAHSNPEVKLGPYVMIAVSDTGVGMSEAIREKVFEPFFTTKELGKGTGLGLSMVYGFVKQSGGHVKIYSEVALGTSIKLYLPRATDQTEAVPTPVADDATVTGDETIFVVEDDVMVRTHVIGLLTGLGYRTLVAEDGNAALALVDGGAGFDLLFTDVIMPGGMNGRQLADAIVRRRGSLRVLYTSGYTENAIVHHGRLDPGVALLNKPYRRIDLARKIREVLAAAPRTA